MKPSYLSLLLLLTANNVYCAPTLQIHIFEEESDNMSNAPAVPRSENEYSPTRKHNLQLHVFERDPTVRTAKISSSDSTITLKDQKPILGYQRAELYGSTGYRKDDLDWSISGLNGTPNILSELEWEDIEIATINLGTTLYFDPNWLLNFDFTYGHIFDGDNQDSDYRGNNRTAEFSRSYADSDKGSTLDGSIYAGYKWLVMHNSLQQITLMPKLGFSYHSQLINDTNGELVISTTTASEFGIEEANPLGYFSGLDSNYDATWFGPWFGLESQLVISDKFKIGLNFEYHYAYYEATANWNLRSDFAHPESFTHEAEGYGLVGNIDAQYRLNNKLSLSLSMNYQDWQADRDGVDKTFFSDETSLKTGFNGVNWKSFGANIGLKYEF